MLKIAICDDNPGCVQEVREGLTSWAEDEKQILQMDDFSDGKYLLSRISEKGGYDLYFLDVEMQEIDGLKAAQQIRQEDYKSAIIFISQSDAYYQAAYEALPFYFLSKPITNDRIRNIMDRYILTITGREEIYTFTSGKEQWNVKVDEILYFTSEKRSVHIICKQEALQFYGKLDQVEKEFTKLKTRFVRVHKSFFVNLKCIRQFNKTELVMINQDRIPVSREFRSNVAELHRRQLMDEVQ